MKILYLTGDYLYSKVHNNLIKNLLLKDASLEIFVFSPVRTENPHGLEDSYYNDERLKVITPIIDIPLQLYRYDFWAKQRSKVRMIEKSIPIRDIDMIHAGTLFSEGGTAYKLHKKYGIPYYVAIRGSDVMIYSKKMPHLWLIANRILRNAKEVSCITPAIKTKMMSYWQYKWSRKQIDNAHIINNGIDSIWIENLDLSVKSIGNPVRILYIGRFDINKNVLRLVEAVKLLKKNKNVSLTLIGGKGEEHEAVLKIVQDNSSYMKYLGQIYDKEALMKIVRNHDVFAMVSHSETFGLVYAECLSQGLPLIYTQGTGFSDIYPQGQVGFGVDSRSVRSISDGILYVINNYDNLRSNISKIDFKRYSWVDIADIYIYIYKSCEEGAKNVNIIRFVFKHLYYTIKYICRIPHDIFRNNRIDGTNWIAKGVGTAHCRFGKYNYVAPRTGMYNVTMGNYCSIGPQVIMGGMEHSHWWYSMSSKISDKVKNVSETVIGNDVWIGANSVIKAGVRIGDGAVVGAQSFVNKDVPPYAVVVGAPAKIIRYRFNEATIKKIQETKYWEYKPETAKKILSEIS